jgi:hypothetical protein
MQRPWFEGGNCGRDAADGTSEEYGKQKGARDCVGDTKEKLVSCEESENVSVVLEREHLLSNFKGDMTIKSATDKEKCWD